MAATKCALKAKDIMTVEPVCVSPSTSIQELVRVFGENEISGAPVVDQEGRVIGVVSKTDLIRRCAEGTSDIAPAYLFEMLRDRGDSEEFSDLHSEGGIPVEDLMTEDPVMVTPETPATTLAQTMVDRRIHRVIVVDKGRFPLGIVTSMDALAAFARAVDR